MQMHIARGLLALLGVVMGVFTIPAYTDPTSNPGLVDLAGDALSLGSTAGAFLGRQLTIILIALLGAMFGQRLLVAMGGFGMAFLNGHDAVFMGFWGGDPATAGAGAVFAVLGLVVVILALGFRQDRAGSI